MLTVHWENIAGESVSEDTVRQRDGQLRELIRHWLNRRATTFHAIWVLERGKISDGLHVHHLLHLPSIPRSLRHDFIEKLEDWTGAAAGDPDTVEPNVIGVAAARQPGESPVWRLERFYGGDTGKRRLFRYITKTRPWDRECLIRGKRCGVSQSLGPKARSRMAYNAHQKPSDSPKAGSYSTGPA